MRDVTVALRVWDVMRVLGLRLKGLLRLTRVVKCSRLSIGMLLSIVRTGLLSLLTRLLIRGSLLGLLTLIAAVLDRGWTRTIVLKLVTFLTRCLTTLCIV